MSERFEDTEVRLSVAYIMISSPQVWLKQCIHHQLYVFCCVLISINC